MGSSSRPGSGLVRRVVRRLGRITYHAMGRVFPSLRRLDLFIVGLRESGWNESHRRQESVDADGRPLPWITYGAISFLGGRLDSSMRVFEYGSGNSTKWWAGKVGNVTAVEHDPEWASRLNGLPGSVVVLERALDDGYAEAIRGLGPFEIVVIDGRDRVTCTRASIDELADDGVVVFDNSDRPQYGEAFEYLATNGFRRLDFNGFGPINVYRWTTSVFYRSNNCVGL